MTHRIAAVAAALTLALGADGFAQTSRWEIDPAHSNASFTVRHMMVSNVRGEFTKLAGGVDVVGDDPTTAKVVVTIDAASINTREPKRDAHLRSADFFDADRFPTITFTSKKIERAGEGRLKLVGHLTMHGVTKEVTLDIEELTPEVKDPGGNLRVGAHATTRINRKDFGLLWNRILASGGVLVGDEVAITIDVELVKKA
ncbi:MAG: YceI family protein [Thermoanaerobaculaceae bacterium]|nr:YceI family protein [Thermoanaerobaculaceae bacterium]